MMPLGKLIDYWHRRERECSAEIDELVERFNRNVPAFLSITEADLTRMVGTWRYERQLARDTAAYLETLQHPRSQEGRAMTDNADIITALERIAATLMKRRAAHDPALQAALDRRGGKPFAFVLAIQDAEVVDPPDTPLPPGIEQIRLTAPLVIANRDEQQTLGIMRLAIRDHLWPSVVGKAAAS